MLMGTDIRRDYAFVNGDIILTTGVFNMGQAVLNRLSLYLGDYDIFYAKYGSTIMDEMGELNHPTIHEYIRIEIEECLKQDPRIRSSSARVYKKDNHTVQADLTVLLINDTELELNLILTDDNTIIINEVQ